MKRLLYVEDECELQDILCDYLEDTFFEIDTAYNDLEAIELLKRREYDVLVIDLKYENGRSARELFRFLESQKRKNEQNFIVVSGFINSEEDFNNTKSETLKCKGVYAKPLGFFDAIDDLEEFACSHS